MEADKIFYCSDKYKLCGILSKPSLNENIVVLCHANCSSKNSNATRSLQLKLSQENINSFSFDFRCCGESSGFENEYTIKGLVNDLKNTLDYLKKIGFSKFILVGMSMGGRVVSLLDASKYNIICEILWYPAIPTYDFPTRLKKFFFKSNEEKIALKEGYCTIHNKKFKLSPEFFRQDRKLFSYRFFKNKLPKLILHGNNDSYVDFKNSERIVKLCKNSSLRIIESGTHSFSSSEETLNEAIDYTIEFIKNNGFR